IALLQTEHCLDELYLLESIDRMLEQRKPAFLYRLETELTNMAMQPKDKRSYANVLVNAVRRYRAAARNRREGIAASAARRQELMAELRACTANLRGLGLEFAREHAMLILTLEVMLIRGQIDHTFRRFFRQSMP
ncbi:MAG: hypothetical protein RLZZ324_1020, partial [Candidatus Parcubacteria bacterium]